VSRNVQSANSKRGGSFLRQLSMQPMDYATDADGAPSGLETVMWTRELAKRLLLPKADVEGLEDLLDTYFMLVSPCLCLVAAMQCYTEHLPLRAF